MSSCLRCALCISDVPPDGCNDNRYSDITASFRRTPCFLLRPSSCANTFAHSLFTTREMASCRRLLSTAPDAPQRDLMALTSTRVPSLFMGTASDRRTRARICDRQDEDGSSGGSRTRVIEFSTERLFGVNLFMIFNDLLHLLTIACTQMLGQPYGGHLHNVRNVGGLAEYL